MCLTGMEPNSNWIVRTHCSKMACQTIFIIPFRKKVSAFILDTNLPENTWNLTLNVTICLQYDIPKTVWFTLLDQSEIVREESTEMEGESKEKRLTPAGKLWPHRKN